MLGKETKQLRYLNFLYFQLQNDNLSSICYLNEELCTAERSAGTPRFSLGCLHMGGIVPPYSAGGQSVNGGTHGGDIDLMGGLTLTDIINQKYC